MTVLPFGGIYGWIVTEISTPNAKRGEPVVIFGANVPRAQAASAESGEQDSFPVDIQRTQDTGHDFHQHEIIGNLGWEDGAIMRSQKGRANNDKPVLLC